MKTQTISIATDYIKADAFLKFSGVAATGGHAKLLIEQGNLLVNGETCTQRGRKLRAGDVIEINGRSFRIE